MAQIDRAVLQRPPAGNVTGLKTLLLGFAAVIPAFLVAALLLTWIFGIPIVIQGVRLEQEPFLIAFGYATMAFLYLRDRNSPHRIAATYLEFLKEQGIEPVPRSGAALVLRAGRLWLSLSRQLEAAGDELRRALLQALNADTPAALGALLARRDVTVQEVEAAVNALIPVLAGHREDVWTIDRLRIVVTNYLETLRDLAALRGGFRPAGQIRD